MLPEKKACLVIDEVLQYRLKILRCQGSLKPVIFLEMS